jgi:hypothetical protein
LIYEVKVNAQISHFPMQLPMVTASVLTVFGPCASAATHHASTIGSDSNPGSQAVPFQHPSKEHLKATDVAGIIRRCRA